MSEWCLESQSELLHPEALPEKELISKLKQARVPVNEKAATRDDLIELFHLHVTPRPQRARRNQTNDMNIDEQSTDRATSLKRRCPLPPEDKPTVKMCTSVVKICRSLPRKQPGGDSSGKAINSMNANRKRSASTSLSDSVIHKDENDGHDVQGEPISKRPFRATPVKWP
jgi:hypothetical protein